MLSRLAMTATAAILLGTTGAALADGHIDAETVVATVGDTEITLGHMIVLKARLPAQYQSLPGDVLFEGILDQLVQQTLLGASLEELSAGSRKTLENEERALRASEVIQQIADDVTTDRAIQDIYDTDFANNPDLREFNADHILFRVDAEASEEDVAAAEARAIETITDLGNGADFATLAQERSEGPSGPSGGALGWFEAGRMVAPFSEAVQTLAPGAISPEPVRTQFGWHVIRLNDTRAPALDAVRAQIVDEIQRAAIEARVADLQTYNEVTRSTVDDIDPALLDDISLLGE